MRLIDADNFKAQIAAAVRGGGTDSMFWCEKSKIWCSVWTCQRKECEFK